MPLHFTPEELAERRAVTCAGLKARDLAGLLMFRQESMYYLTGYDTFGYVFFQCLYIGADGTLTLLTRAPDVRAAAYTSMLQDVRMWVDGPTAQPALELRDILAEHGLAGARLGVEWDAYGLTAANGHRLSAAMDGFCDLVDASDLVTRQRAAKRPAEIAYVRKAAELADAALKAALPLIKPHAWEGDILAALQSTVLAGDGDYSGNEFIIGSGPGQNLGRYVSGRRRLEADDTLAIEFAGVFRHYHSALMRTYRVGRRDERLCELHDVGLAALEACRCTIRPGASFGDIFAAYTGTLEAAGFTGMANRLNACGYGLGTTFSPNWMDWPMVYRANPALVEEGMVIFLHMVVTEGERNVAPGETFLVTAEGCERLGRMPITLDPLAAA
ncbi:M24 family metallopeptidase [Ancylobacter terrae]|uniref:M24 family metallopeptidase n=1 Tax=Ancylobacter sp. sgz301288 TaxID=3342077 RepID=UPI0038595CB1